MVKKRIGILGYGEIGKSIARFYSSTGSGQAKIKDLKRDDGLVNLDVLHVCIPWSEKFIDIVKKEIKKSGAKLTVIHSTVVPGTTKKIGGHAVHSPVRGVHPNLYEGIKTFVKYIGADDKKTGQLANKHLAALGIPTRLVHSSKTTEALKLWDTTQYGLSIILNKEIKKWCDKVGVDFEIAYTDANKTYNQGYKKLCRHEVIRPYLKYMPGKVGGHCIIPNAHLLDSEIAKFILKRNSQYK